MSNINDKGEKLLTYPLAKLLKYFIPDLYADQGCKLEDEDLATLIALIDKQEEWVHVEFPTVTSPTTYPILWRIKAWKQSQLLLDRKRRNREQENLEIDNYKYNLNALCTKLSSMLGMEPATCIPLARSALLNKHIPDDRIAVNLETKFGVKIREPFYRKMFESLPVSHRHD
jgi:hypothetical protein